MICKHIIILSFAVVVTARSLERVNIETNYTMIENKTAPYFKQPNKLFSIEMKPAGSTARLRCAAGGFPQPNITWFKNNKTPIKRQFPLEYKRWSINLEELTKADNGNYTCKICNELGCISHTYNFVVQERYPGKPFIKDGFPGNHTVLENDTIELSCPMISDLEPYVYWMRSDTNSTNNSTMIVESTNENDKPEHLTIYNATKNDQGWYACTAINTLGNSTSWGYVTVVKELINTDAASNHKENNFVIGLLTAIFSTMMAVAAMVFMILFKKLKRKQRKIDIDKEMLFKKRIVVEKPHNVESTDMNMLMPAVHIENSNLQVSNNADSSLEYDLPLDVEWEIPRSALSFGNILGEGEFGIVIKAECEDVMNKVVKSTVAVKMLKDVHSDSDMVSLVSEMEIMKIIGKHINIINLLGCCTQDGPLYVIVEYALYGNLKQFLREHKSRYANQSALEGDENISPLTENDLVSFSYQVARGMEYLASRGCIHRDLAARNILVSDNYLLKIADFGLAKDVRNSEYYRKETSGRLPVWWMAPESLSQMIFSSQSDVWSFGVLVWEIMTFGATPYFNIPGHYILQYLSNGNRLEKPTNCQPEIYTLMTDCWKISPEDRPLFSELVQDLDKILTVTSNQEYLVLESMENASTPSKELDTEAV